MSLSHSPQIVTNGLILYLDAANTKSYPGTGTTWTDLSGNNRHGTLTGGPTYSSSNGGHIAFDGVDDRAPIANPSGFSTVRTVAVFVSQNAPGGGDYAIYGIDANGQDNWLGIESNVIRFLGTQSTDVNNFNLYGTTTLLNDAWYQIACTINGATATIYLNGAQQATTTRAFTIGSWDTSATIGRRGSIASRYFPGKIACVQAYSRVLTASEINDNFNAHRGRFGI